MADSIISLEPATDRRTSKIIAIVEEDRRKTEFLTRVTMVKSEIKAKFQSIREEFDEKELNLLLKVAEIEQEIIEKYESLSVRLKEMIELREETSRILKCNSHSLLLEKNLETSDKEIETIIRDTKIESNFNLTWNSKHFDITNEICEITTTLNKLQLKPLTIRSRNSQIIDELNSPEEVDVQDEIPSEIPTSPSKHFSKRSPTRKKCLHCNKMNKSDELDCIRCDKSFFSY